MGMKTSKIVFIILCLSTALFNLYQARNGIAIVKSSPTFSGDHGILVIPAKDFKDTGHNAVDNSSLLDVTPPAVNGGHGGTNSGIDIASDNDATKATDPDPDSVAELSRTTDTSEEQVEVKVVANEPTSIQKQQRTVIQLGNHSNIPTPDRRIGPNGEKNYVHDQNGSSKIPDHSNFHQTKHRNCAMHPAMAQKASMASQTSSTSGITLRPPKQVEMSNFSVQYTPIRVA